ncbi:hypothetical protein BDA99DRAFT_534996 [Phascolomyces articulosus]|uniref:Uncharacterized protein n=1 Tax=Phascolomyces articulosus TaxID=60185 RepID=A0AAD5KDV5_9FUNG|nr:hypothetical protein BDA99DRAFT_534996 [Phascolomyces articulosus]
MRMPQSDSEIRSRPASSRSNASSSDLVQCLTCNREFLTFQARDEHQIGGCQLSVPVQYYYPNNRRSCSVNKIITRSPENNHFYCPYCDFQTIYVDQMVDHARHCDNVKNDASRSRPPHRPTKNRRYHVSTVGRPKSPIHRNNMITVAKQELFSDDSDSDYLSDVEEEEINNIIRRIFGTLFYQNLTYTLIIFFIAFFFFMFIHFHLLPKCSDNSFAQYYVSKVKK